jgi:hypothetical protein
VKQVQIAETWWPKARRVEKNLQKFLKKKSQVKIKNKNSTKKD